MNDMNKRIWQALLLINLLIIIFYWWQGSSALLTESLTGMAIAFGRLAGFLAAGTVLLQFVFMGRTPWLERIFGLDKLAGIHRLNGKLTLIFLLLHPLLLIYGYSKASEVGLLAQFLDFVLNYPYVGYAALGFTLFLIVGISSLIIIRQKLRYESWYFTHLLVYLAVFASFWHQIEVGTTLISNQLFYGYWISLYAVVLVNHVLFRFGRPVYLYHKHKFQVSRVVRENYNTVSMYITGRNLNGFDVKPGQFMIFRFLTKGMWWQAHPFSLSRLPNGKELRITVKEMGDFTKQVGAIPTGTKVVIDGPYGIFTQWVSISPKVLFIAGGIGITPIRSLMEEMLQKGKDVVLLYGNNTAKDIVFKDEIEALSKQYQAKIVHVLSSDTGNIDEEKIKKLVPDFSERDIYLCGPIPMTDALIKMFATLQVPRSKIHYEKFAL